MTSYGGLGCFAERLLMSVFSNVPRAVRYLSLVFMLLFSGNAFSAPKSKLIEFWNDHEANSRIDVNHDDWQSILSEYVEDQHPSGISRFNYEAVTAADALKLKAYIDYLELLEPRQLNLAEAQAYWINLYNALLLDKVVDTYQEGSTRAVNRLLKGRLRSTNWGRNITKVALQNLSLDDIEHGILRPMWNDPRIHFVITSGALSGANIIKTAFNGDNNEELLEQSKLDFFSHQKSAYVDGKRIVLNSMFNWYRDDFATDKDSLLRYIRTNVSEEVRKSMEGLSRIRYEYVWALNAPSTEFVVLSDDEDEEDEDE